MDPRLALVLASPERRHELFRPLTILPRDTPAPHLATGTTGRPRRPGRARLTATRPLQAHMAAVLRRAGIGSGPAAACTDC